MHERRKSYNKGLWLEKLAALYLVLKGYKILAMRYKTRAGEIDIVARRRKTLVFVEVKGRRDINEALESVHAKNRSRVEQAARHFLSRHQKFAQDDMRFDVILFAPPFSFRHLDNAWQARS